MSIARPNWDSISRHARAVSAASLLTGLYCVIALGLAAPSVAVAQDAPNSLDNIEVRALPGNRIELRLVTSGAAPEPLAFTIDEPARIAIDLRDTVLGLKARRKDVGIGALDTILAAEANGRTRVVLNLDVNVGYQTRVEGNSIVVTLDSAQGSGAAAMAGAGSSAIYSTETGDSAGENRVQHPIERILRAPDGGDGHELQGRQQPCEGLDVEPTRSADVNDGWPDRL